MNESIVSIYNRTYNNCEYYLKNNDNKRFLNEIGALRGIVYCLETTIGTGNIYAVIDYRSFVDMIKKASALLATN